MADSDNEDEKTIADFKKAVNMTASVLAKWLDTPESKEVGYKGEDGNDDSKESVGHKSGKRIVEILHKKKADCTDDDLAHMKKVVSYVARHSAQEPQSDDLENTHWTYSLKNWGHDPLK